MADSYDVVVVGAGNAALCAAIAAREAGARVLVVEKASEGERGGNSFFSGGGFRYPYEGLDDIRQVIPDLSDGEVEEIDVGSYPASAMRSDLMRVTEGLAEPGLVDTLVGRAFDTMNWMRERAGMRWVLMYGRQAYRVDDKLRFWGGMITEAVGGGEGLSELLFTSALEQGVDVRYGTKGTALLTDDRNAILALRVQGEEGFEEIATSSVVLAAGGFEANTEMRTRYLGAGWEFAKVRGTRHNNGDGIRMALDIGAQSYGHWSSAHAVAWDLNAPPTGNRRIGDLYQKHSYPLGLIVNIDGERFVDEGADLRNYTYAKYGREILKQRHSVAFQLFDQKAIDMLRDEYRIREVTKGEGSTVAELADQMGIHPANLERTIEQYNAACRSDAQEGYNPTLLDGVSTEGLPLPKSNWALPFDEPPYVGYAVTCGISFTFGGLHIDPKSGAVLDTDERPIAGLFAAGELVGGLFYHNYAGGSGLMAGAVFGRMAGESAARRA